MTNKIRFHLDENVNLAIARGLRKQGVNVSTTQESNLLGATDLEQLDFARQEDRAIFTQDRDFLILASQSSNHAGIVYAPKNNRSIGQLLNSLQLIYELLSPEEMRDHIEYI